MQIKELMLPVKKKEKARALLLLSGGLDSVLAGKILEEREVDIIAVTFQSLFFEPPEAVKAAEEHGWPLVVVDISEEQIQIVEKPKYGYGKNMNPCIDCHGQMIRLAGELLEKYQADFVATGEVLGERPKSQSREALRIVESLSGLKGLVLRPLSARLLPATRAEESGLVDRERLLDLSGRSRKRQMELAEKYGMREYPAPAGGCLLTDPAFSERLKKLMEWRGTLKADDIKLIKTGRVIFERYGMIIVGRDEKDNERIRKNLLAADIIISTVEVRGPLTLVRMKNVSQKKGRKAADKVRAVPDAALVKKAALLTIRYSRARQAEEASVVLSCGRRKETKRFKKKEWQNYF